MKVTTKLFLVAVFVLGLTLVAVEINHSLYVYPTPETQSAFLKSYTPAPVIDRFKRNYSSSSWQSGASAAGRKAARHTAELTQYFVTEAKSSSVIVTAVRDDISAKLAEQGVRITGQLGSAAGDEIKYEIGKTRGIVAIDQLQRMDPTTVAGHAGIGHDEVAVMLRVRIAETWSKSGPESRTDWPTLRNP